MKQFARGLVILSSLWMLCGCLDKGSAADPPVGGLTVTPGDGRVTLSWAEESGVEYWAFYVAGTSISADKPTSTTGHVNVMNVHSPLIVAGLTNGVTYAFTVNGSIDGGPGGVGTPSVTAVPRLAGASWTAGASLGAFDLKAVASGTVGGNIFVAVGTNGTIASSADGLSWNMLASGSSADLNAVAFGGTGYVAAGAGGVMLYSSDGATWAAEPSPTANAIHGMTSNGAGSFVGVGANGTIVYGNGTSWALATSPTTADLHAVAYGNGGYVAVGAAGTLLTSSDGVNWTAQPSNSAANLTAIAYGINAADSTLRFVAGGASGALIASSDGVTWTTGPALPVSGINSIAYGTQFVLVGDAGSIYTSTDAASWQAQSSGTANALKGVAHNATSRSYSAVGSSGTNLSAY